MNTEKVLTFEKSSMFSLSIVMFLLSYKSGFLLPYNAANSKPIHGVVTAVFLQG